MQAWGKALRTPRCDQLLTTAGRFNSDTTSKMPWRVHNHISEYGNPPKPCDFFIWNQTSECVKRTGAAAGNVSVSPEQRHAASRSDTRAASQAFEHAHAGTHASVRKNILCSQCSNAFRKYEFLSSTTSNLRRVLAAEAASVSWPGRISSTAPDRTTYTSEHH